MTYRVFERGAAPSPTAQDCPHEGCAWRFQTKHGRQMHQKLVHEKSLMRQQSVFRREVRSNAAD